MKELYEKNQKCLLLIPRITALFREQSFFLGVHEFLECLHLLDQIVADVCTCQDIEFDEEGMMELLKIMLLAQESADYLYIADILEGDLLPLLQTLQLELSKRMNVELQDYWDDNLLAIREADEILYKKLMETETSENERFQMMIAINGQPVLRVMNGEKEIHMGSVINPQWEADMFAKVYEEESHQYVVYGMGMGYHVKALLDMDSRNKVIVLENEIQVLRYALRYCDWRHWLVNQTLHIIYDDNIMELLKKLKIECSGNFIVHYPSLLAVQNKKIKTVLEDYFIKTSSMREQKKFLDENFDILQKRGLPSCEELKALIMKEDIIIVAGGPSVDDQLTAIKKYRNQFKLMAVGTIARKLMENGIVPDFIIISDPQSLMYQQVEGLETENIPLILLSTASAGILEYYKGPVYVAYQEGYKRAVEEAQNRACMLFQTGGSVSTVALDIGIRFEAEKIILVGMDMAYTEKRSHAAGIGREVTVTDGLRLVESTQDTMVYTSRNLDTYRKWIENRLKDEDKINVYNTSFGARIKGTIEMQLEQIYGTE